MCDNQNFVSSQVVHKTKFNCINNTLSVLSLLLTCLLARFSQYVCPNNIYCTGSPDIMGKWETEICCSQESERTGTEKYVCVKSAYIYMYDFTVWKLAYIYLSRMPAQLVTICQKKQTSVITTYKGAKTEYTYIVYRGFNHSVCVLWAEFYIYSCFPTFSTKYTHTHTYVKSFLQNLPSSVLSEVLWIRRMLAQLMPQKIMTTTRMKKEKGYTRKSVTMVLCSLQHPSFLPKLGASSAHAELQ